MLVRLRGELARIPQPSGARRTSHSETNKATSTLVEDLFVGGIAWSDLRSHFDSVLGADGWSFVREYGYTNHGRDYGGKIATYRKSTELVSVDSPGLDTTAGYTYALSIRWEVG